MLYTPLTKLALKLCFEAHKNQTDKSGLPYVFHPFHLAEQMGISQEDLFLPPDHQQKRQEDAKAHLLQLKRLLEGLE